MKIKTINAICCNIPLSSTFKFASTELRLLPYAWVRVETEDGIIGYGECPTYWDPSGETQQAAVGAIDLVAPQLIGLEVYNMENIFQIFDATAYGAFAAKCGLDMALYDIVGKSLNVPVYILLGGGGYSVNVNAVLPMGIQNIETRVKQLLSQGYLTFKVKVGVDLQQELGLLKTVSRLLPAETRIFVDANQGWKDAKSAIRAIRCFEELGVVWVEQPIRANDIDGLKLIRQSVNMSVILDESLYSSIDALRLIKADAVDIFNIKLAKCGGMYLGKKLFAVAQAGNISCMLGSMIESSLGMLANYHFARAHPMITCGLSAYSYVAEKIDVGITFTNGQMSLSAERPGLGYPDATPFEEKFQS